VEIDGVINDLLIVVHRFREEDSIIRIISARKANKNESQEYMIPKPLIICT
jgi:uncharacterized DUF497 family protein